MTLALFGTLPVSSINLGLASGQVGLGTITATLSADVSRLSSAVDLQTEFSLEPLDPTSVSGSFTASQNQLETAALLNPTAFATISADFNADTVSELAFVEAQLGGLDPIVADLKTGIAAPDLVGWSYAGRAAGFGSRMATATLHGIPGVTAPTEINAIIIATNLFASWRSFGEGFEVGSTASEELTSSTTVERLNLLGTLDGGRWNIGAEAVLAPLERMRLTLEGAKAALQSQIQVTTGAQLPAVSVLLDAGADISISAALDNLLNVQVDLGADISGIDTRIEANADLIAELAAQLSAGGLTIWTYSGRADGLGAALQAELQGGLPGTQDGPNGALYGVVIATANNSAWSSFGRIVLTG